MLFRLPVISECVRAFDEREEEASLRRQTIMVIDKFISLAPPEPHCINNATKLFLLSLSLPRRAKRVSVSHVECQTRNLSTQSGRKFSSGRSDKYFPRKRNEIPGKLHSQRFLNFTFFSNICCSTGKRFSPTLNSNFHVEAVSQSHRYNLHAAP